MALSPSSYGEYATAFCGFSNWELARTVHCEVVDAIHSFAGIANDFDMTPEVARLINKQLDSDYLENRLLLKSK